MISTKTVSTPGGLVTITKVSAHDKIIIPTDSPSWYRLPDPVRSDAYTWAAILNAVHTASNKKEKIRMLARKHQRGFSCDNIRKRYWRAFGKPKMGWRACVNWADVSGKKCLPAIFVEHWIKLNEAFQRDLSGRRACSRLKEQFRRWAAGDHTAAVPGFKECPRLQNGLPYGCSYDSLMRILRARQSRAESVAARRGLAAARAHLPHIPQDVSQVRPLEYVVFDDVEIDFLISIAGSTTPVKLRLLVAMDLCSRVILGFGVRPGIIRPDGVTDSLKLRDMKCIVARFLKQWGYPVDYPCTLICERATAAIPDPVKKALLEISQGQVLVSDTSMIVGQVFEFWDRASGNSWGKAWLESFFNWLHNELGDREGQKGLRYDRAPAELHGRTRELAILERAGIRMPLALRQQLRRPFMDGAQAMQELQIAFAKANDRTDHALQGFDKIQMWRLDGTHPWAPFEELPLFAQKLGLDVAALSQRAEWTSRMESPNERFAARIGAVARKEVGPHSLRRLMDEHRLVKFENWQFSFTFEKKEYVYLPGDALACVLEHEAQYLAWFDPQDMTVIYLTRPFPDCGWIAEVELFKRTRRGEITEKKEALAKTKHCLTRAANLVAGRHPEKFDTAIARAEQNCEIIRHAAALEVECDVVSSDSSPPTDGVAVATDSPAVRQITGRIMSRAAAASEEKKSRKRELGAARFGEILREVASSKNFTADDADHTDGKAAAQEIEEW